MCAAEEVFGSKGYYEASIVNITQEAKVAHGTFIITFHLKKDIFDELIHRLNRELRLIIKGEMEGISSYEEAQRRGFQAFFRWVKDRPNLYNIVQQAVVVDDNLYRWYYAKLANGFLKVYRLVWKRESLNGLIKKQLRIVLCQLGNFRNAMGLLGRERCSRRCI